MRLKDLKNDEKKVTHFGTEAKEKRYKNGSFQTYSSVCWIKLENETKKLYIEDCNFKDLTKLFPDHSKLKTRKEKLNTKKNILKKIIEWQCTIEIKNSIKIVDIKKAKKCLENHVIYYIPTSKTSFYYVWKSFFKNSLTDEYVYMDLENSCFKKTGLISGRGQVTKEKLLDWEKEYLNEVITN